MDSSHDFPMTMEICWTSAVVRLEGMDLVASRLFMGSQRCNRSLARTWGRRKEGRGQRSLAQGAGLPGCGACWMTLAKRLAVVPPLCLFKGGPGLVFKRVIEVGPFVDEQGMVWPWEGCWSPSFL